MTYRVKTKMSAMTKEGDFVTLNTGEVLTYRHQEKGWITAIRNKTKRDVAFHVQRLEEGVIEEMDDKEWRCKYNEDGPVCCNGNLKGDDWPGEISPGYCSKCRHRVPPRA